MFNVKLIESFGSHSLVLSQPGVGHYCPKDWGEVAQSNEGVIDGGGQVIVPAQEIPEVQHQDSCGQGGILSCRHGRTQLHVKC